MILFTIPRLNSTIKSLSCVLVLKLFKLAMALAKEVVGEQLVDSKIPVDGQHHESKGDVGLCSNFAMLVLKD